MEVHDEATVALHRSGNLLVVAFGGFEAKRTRLKLFPQMEFETVLQPVTARDVFEGEKVFQIILFFAVFLLLVNTDSFRAHCQQEIHSGVLFSDGIRYNITVCIRTLS